MYLSQAEGTTKGGQFSSSQDKMTHWRKRYQPCSESQSLPSDNKAILYHFHVALCKAGQERNIHLYILKMKFSHLPYLRLACKTKMAARKSAKWTQVAPLGVHGTRWLHLSSAILNLTFLVFRWKDNSVKVTITLGPLHYVLTKIKITTNLVFPATSRIFYITLLHLWIESINHLP